MSASQIVAMPCSCVPSTRIVMPLARKSIGAVRRDFASEKNGKAIKSWLSRGAMSPGKARDRKSTRLNSSHSQISYAVFCLKKKKGVSDGLVLTPALVTAGGGSAPLHGGEAGSLEVIRDGAVALRDGLITYARRADGLTTDGLPDPVRVDGAVVPRLLGRHTPLPSIGW